MGHTMGFPKANRKKTGFEHWQEGLDQEQTSATDTVLQADPTKLARCASPNSVVSVAHIRACCSLSHVLRCLHLSRSPAPAREPR